MKAIGQPCWVSTTPIPSLEALVSTIKGSSKFGMAKMGVVVMAWLSLRKASSASSFHLNYPFFSKLVRGRAMSP